MNRRKKRQSAIDFSFDSLADIVSNILGIMVLLGVMIGITSKDKEQEKKEKEKDEREKVIGKMDAMSDLFFKDNRLAMPLEREARYNRFHVHCIVKNNRIYFIDLAEFNYRVHNEGNIQNLNDLTFGDCKVSIDPMLLQLNDKAYFYPDNSKGLLVNNSTSAEEFRKLFRLEKQVDDMAGRFLTRLAPNNHAVHFHVYPSGVEAFNAGNSYLRMLGFDTGYILIPENENARVLIPLNLQDGQKQRNKQFIQ